MTAESILRAEIIRRHGLSNHVFSLDHEGSFLSVHTAQATGILWLVETHDKSGVGVPLEGPVTQIVIGGRRVVGGIMPVGATVAIVSATGDRVLGPWIFPAGWLAILGADQPGEVRFMDDRDVLIERHSLQPFEVGRVRRILPRRGARTITLSETDGVTTGIQFVRSRKRRWHFRPHD